jgi:S-adenosylmethionine:diacylglycerol 3-amino-3-carboxypropyl transferase
LKALLTDGTEIHFGLKGGFTYVDEKDKTKRYNYFARHMANKTEKKLITSLTPSPSLFSSMILWGKYDDIDKNKDLLNKLFRMKYI